MQNLHDATHRKNPMSNIQYAFLQRHRVPDRPALQASIDALGFDLQLHAEYAPFTDHGFLPFVLDGEDGPGFEIQFTTADAVTQQDPALKAIAAGRDHCISMAWHGSMKDLACVLIVSCALIQDFDAVVSYEGEAPEPLENLLATAREVLAEEQAREEDPPGKPILPVRKPWWKLW